MTLKITMNNLCFRVQLDQVTIHPNRTMKVIFKKKPGHVAEEGS